MDLVFLARSERERTHDVFLARTERIRDNVLHSWWSTLPQESREREYSRSLPRSCHVTSCLIPATTTAIPLCTRCGSEFKAEPRDTMFLNSHSLNLCKTKTGITLIISHMSASGNFQDTKQKPVNVNETALGFLYRYFSNSCGSSKRNYNDHFSLRILCFLEWP